MMLKKASEFLNKVRDKVLTISVLYNDETVNATLGKTIFKIENSFGLTYIESTDFLISVDALLDVPVQGDIIAIGEVEYEVLAPDNEPIYRYTDGYENTYRIHTKKVS